MHLRLIETIHSHSSIFERKEGKKEKKRKLLLLAQVFSIP
jgi:hypothetical protein